MYRGVDSFSILKLIVTDLDVLERLTQSCGFCYPHQCELRQGYRERTSVASNTSFVHCTT